MPLYSYKARNLKGEVERGTIEGTERSIVYTLLKNKGLFPIDIKETSYNRASGQFNIKRKVPLVTMYLFCKQFSIMINAGVPIIQTLDILIKQEDNVLLRKTLRKVAEDIHKGLSLSESMKKYDRVFPNILVSMIEVGEMSGNLDKALEEVSMHFEKENSIRSKIKTAMIYPLFILGVAILAVIFMIAFIVPKFISMFAAVGGELPAITQMVLNLADKFREPLFLTEIVLVILLSIWAFNIIKKSKEGGMIIDRLYFKVPLLKTEFKKILAARFARTLSLLVSAGVPIIQSFDVITTVINNKVVSKGIEDAKNEIRSGSNIAKPLAAMNIFPKMVIQMIIVGEETGTMDSTIAKIADFYDEEVDNSIKKLTSIIEPAMILLIAAFVGIVVIAMILPVFSLEEQMGTIL